MLCKSRIFLILHQAASSKSDIFNYHSSIFSRDSAKRRSAVEPSAVWSETNNFKQLASENDLYLDHEPTREVKLNTTSLYYSKLRSSGTNITRRQQIRHENRILRSLLAGSSHPLYTAIHDSDFHAGRNQPNCIPAAPSAERPCLAGRFTVRRPAS